MRRLFDNEAEFQWEKEAQANIELLLKLAKSGAVIIQKGYNAGSDS